MSFFEPTPEPVPQRVTAQRTPSWVGPPDNWVPQILPLSLIVATSDDIVVPVSKFAAYPTGFEFELTTLSRTTDPSGRTGWMIGSGHPHDARFGVQYPDGARATLPPRSTGRPQQGISLLPQGATATETVRRLRIWVTPLPPVGPVTLAAAWPERGVAEGAVTVDGGQFVAAAEGAVQIWPDEVDEPVEADFSDMPALPVEGARPADAETSEHDIRTAFSHVFDNGPQASADPLTAVQDGDALAGALAEVRSRFPVEAATTRVAVGRIVFLDDVRAAVTFRFAVRTARPDYGTQLGYAVRDRGQWKVARDTYCRVLGWAGVQCPPPPPPP